MLLGADGRGRDERGECENGGLDELHRFLPGGDPLSFRQRD
jgi:hypothetical protein